MATMKMVYITVSKEKMKCIEHAISKVKFQGYITGDVNRAWRADHKREVKTLWDERKNCYDHVLVEPVGPYPRRRYQLRRSDFNIKKRATYTGGGGRND